MEPINYLAAMPQINLGQQLTQGLQAGALIGQIEQQRQAQALAIQEAQEKKRLAEQYRADMEAYFSSPSAKGAAMMMAKYPQQREAFKDGWSQLSAEQQQTELRDIGELGAALASGSAPVALSKVEQRIAAAKNAGQDTTSLEEIKARIEADPVSAMGYVDLITAMLPGGEKIIANRVKLAEEARSAAKAPIELRKAEADAQVAGSEALIRAEDAKVAPQMSVAKLNEQLAKANREAVAAKFAESKAVQDLKLGEAQIRALATDEQIKRQNVAIASMNAQTARAGNDLKRQELQLKVDEMVQKRDSTVREKVAGAEAAASTIDSMMNTIERIKQNPRLNAVVGGIEGRTPAIRDESVNAIALIDTLGSQAFLSQIPQIKGMGQLSNAEGEKLQAAFQNFSRVQSEKQFRANLEEATRLLDKARKGIEKSSGVRLPMSDVPATAPPSQAQLDDLLKKYGGK